MMYRKEVFKSKPLRFQLKTVVVAWKILKAANQFCPKTAQFSSILLKNCSIVLKNCSNVLKNCSKTAQNCSKTAQNCSQYIFFI